MDVTTKITPKLSETTNKLTEATNSTVTAIQSTVLEPEIITETSKLAKPSKTNLKFKDYESN